MSQPAEHLSLRSSGAELVALARIGLAAFVADRLPQQQDVALALRREAARLVDSDRRPEWPSLLEAVQGRWPPTGDPLALLVQDMKLSLPEALVFCLAAEAEASHAVVLALAVLQGPDGPPRLTVHLAVAIVETLMGGGRLDALACQGLSSVRHGLLELVGDEPLPLRELRVSPMLWATLRGGSHPWAGCQLLPAAGVELLPASLRQSLPRLASALAKGKVNGAVLRAQSLDEGRSAAVALAHALGRRALLVPASQWEETPALGAGCRYGGWLPVLEPALGPGESWRPPGGRVATPYITVLGTDGAVDDRDVLEITLPAPTAAERRRVWERHWHGPVPAAALAGAVLLNGHTIARVARYASAQAGHAHRPPERADLAEGRRRLASDRLRLLAQPVESSVSGEALVVPAPVAAALRNLVERARGRDAAHAGLGVTLAATGHPGLRALFTGASGTGKSLAASYVATCLDAPLYRVDLGAVMNKYIGESEKNLGRLLDAAAADDVVLLFDEADALFGRRSAGKQSGERYANMLTNFLLTRIEHHPGVVILTSNARERIDEAFTRRLDHVVEFPLPAFDERLRLWRSHLGGRAPDEQTLRHLASHCDLAGGHLRLAVLDATVGIEPDERVTLPALVSALQVQYRKLGRGLPPALDRLLGFGH